MLACFTSILRYVMMKSMAGYYKNGPYEVRWDGMDWICLAEGSYWCWTHVNLVINLLFS